MGRAASVGIAAALAFGVVVATPGGRTPAVAAGTDYRDAVLADSPVAYWRLGESSGAIAVDSTGALDAAYVGGPVLGQSSLVLDADTAVAFDGVDDVVAVPDSSSVNLGVFGRRTIEAWFEVSDTGRRQVVAEEGGVSRGLGIYVDGGMVYFGGWNPSNDGPSSPWGPTFLSAPVTPNQPHHVVLVLNEPAGTIEGFLDGVSIGSSADAGILYWHGSDTGIGAMNNATLFHDGSATGEGHYLEGVVDEVAFYNSALSASRVAAHYNAGAAAPVDPSVTFVAPGAGAELAGIVTVEVAATDPQDGPAQLSVAISTDGGATFTPATFNPGPRTHSIDWDTTAGPDGPVALVAEVTDTDANTGSDSRGVTVRNNPGSNAYRDAVLADGPVAYWRLGEAGGVAATDEVGTLDATYEGAPTLGQPGLVIDDDPAPVFDGVDDLVAVPDSSLINLGTVARRTIEAWFEVIDVAGRQVIVEEGGGTRGLNIYVDQGRLYAGGWNNLNDGPDAPWGPFFLSAPVTPDIPHHVVLVLDQPAGSLSAYLDGVAIGSVGGVGRLYSHGSDTGIAAMNNAARFHDSSQGGDGYHLAGTVDEVVFYNSALSASRVAAHYATGSAPAVDPSVGFLQPGPGDVLAGAVTIEVAASDPQDAPGALTVNMSTDGGSTFTPAAFDAGSETHSLLWDTTAGPEGSMTLVAEVIDTDGNTGSSSIGVTVRNVSGGTDYRDLIIGDGPIAYWRLGESGGSTAVDEMGTASATYVGSPGLGAAGLVADADTAADFTGGDFAAIPDASPINGSNNAERTVEAWFRADSVSGRHVIFQEGGGTRGISMYVDQGSVYVGAWNLAGQAWGPIFFSAPVAAGEVYHVAIVLDNGNLEGFLNGISIGSDATAGILRSHSNDGAIGAEYQYTLFHDGLGNGEGFYFDGVIDEVALYNAPLGAATIAAHYTAGTVTPQNPSVGFVVPAPGDTVAGLVTVEVVASDPQDAAADLVVEVSSDGGVTFSAASFNAGTGRHELVWDTTAGVDGAVSLVARVTDLDLNTASDSVGVTVANAAPTTYRDAVLASGPDIYWRLDETAGTTAVDIISGIDGAYAGSPTLGVGALVSDANGAVAFDGVDDYVAVPNSSLINTVTRTERTISLWFNAADVTTRQVIFEEGGSTRGISIYLDQGSVYLGAWNTNDDSSADTPWGPTFISTPVAAGTTYNAVIVLDQPTARLEAYLNGDSIGSGTGGTLHGHPSLNAIGAMSNAVRFHDGSVPSSSGYFFDGTIDEVTLYNGVLGAATINSLYLTGAALAVDPAVVFVYPTQADVVSGAITIETQAFDPQEASATLDVDISTDGGVTFAPAIYNGASGRHEMLWDTTSVSDGPATLVAQVADSDGNTAIQAIVVTVSNAGAGAMIIAAGDISTCANTNDSDTADLIDDIIAGTTLPVTVVPVGDTVYEDASDADYANCYEPTWGRHKAITQPVIGNHEFLTPEAAGYFNYFGAAAVPPDGWYRYELAGWEVYALNSNCGAIGGCGAASPQVQWLRSELAASTNSCTLGFWHHPRFVEPTPNSFYEEFWRAFDDFNGDLVVNAHAHYYVEGSPVDWQGNPDAAGIRQLIAGTGGRSLATPPATLHPSITATDNSEYGVLVLELSPGGYTWQFVAVDGTVMYSGSGSCN